MYVEFVMCLHLCGRDCYVYDYVCFVVCVILVVWTGGVVFVLMLLFGCVLLRCGVCCRVACCFGWYCFVVCMCVVSVC